MATMRSTGSSTTWKAILPKLSAPPVLVGASLGGLTSLLAVGDHGLPAVGLILVDVTPQLETSEDPGRICAFSASASAAPR